MILTAYTGKAPFEPENKQREVKPNHSSEPSTRYIKDQQCRTIHSWLVKHRDPVKIQEYPWLPRASGWSRSTSCFSPNKDFHRHPSRDSFSNYLPNNRLSIYPFPHGANYRRVRRVTVAILYRRYNTAKLGIRIDR